MAAFGNVEVECKALEGVKMVGVSQEDQQEFLNGLHEEVAVSEENFGLHVAFKDVACLKKWVSSVQERMVGEIACAIPSPKSNFALLTVTSRQDYIALQELSDAAVDHLSGCSCDCE